MSSISNKIMKLREYDDCIMYKSSCECTAPDHDLFLEMEVDKGYTFLSLRFYGNIYYGAYNCDDNWFKRTIKRIKASLQMLFKGYLESEFDFLMSDDKHIMDFISALQLGRAKLLKWEE